MLPPSAGRTRNLRWLSPTVRCSTTAKSPLHIGSGNADPQGPASRNERANSRLRAVSGNGPSVTIAPLKSALGYKCCIRSAAHFVNSSSADSAIVRPAAIAWPPNFSIRPGLALDIAASKSRICTPGIDRPEPLRNCSSSRAKAITGRWHRSRTRAAMSPTTPWCHDSS